MTGARRLFPPLLTALAFGLALGGCASVPLSPLAPSERDAIGQRLSQDIGVLASDAFGGRKPGTPGEALTLDYIENGLGEAGVQPGTNIPGSPWRAPVPLIGATPQPGTLGIARGKRETTLKGEDLAFFVRESRTLIAETEMLFVGRRTDVPRELAMGRVVVMLNGAQSTARRQALFELDPAAIVTVTEDPEDIRQLQRSYGEEALLLASGNAGAAMAIASDAGMARALGEDRWRKLREAAREDGFEPVVLEALASIDAGTRRREFVSNNIIGLLPGTRPEAGSILLLAHWDHLGECEPDSFVDRVCNGAVDNASGVASMLELARRLAATGPYDRNIYFLATTAEESGLLGAKAFVAEPPEPLDTFVAAFNFDTVALAPQGSPVGFVGEGRTPLDAIVLEAIAATGRRIGGREFAESFVQRQDGWALLQGGVPAVFLSSAFGTPDLAWPYLERDYHRVSDNADKVELGGAIDDLLLHETLVRKFASVEGYSPPVRAESGAPGIAGED
ncbi:M20/M25/M40 family metallo-hydrolase [Erythrobacter sp.]|uniref:M20/M25/M40 family metallo-hydrolase n=1 Tax=Erythrobacter sp. TaxID=1042 RepID=UPI003C75243F